MLCLQRLAAGQIQVDPKELQEEFEAEYGPKVRTLLISARTRVEAENIRQQCLAAPERFGDLAKEHSIDPNSAASRGVIPPIRKHVGYPEIEDVAFALKEGEISQVIEVANQFLILKCEQQVPATFVVANDVQPIKERLGERIRYGKLRQASGELLGKLQESSKIVNVYNDPKLREQNPDVAAILNGRPIPLSQLAEECMAYYGREVLQGEINRKVISQALARARVQVTRSDMDAEVLRAADAYGYLKADGSPDRDAWLKSVEEEDGQPIDIYMRDVVWPSAALKKLVSNRVQVTDEDLQKGFTANYGERVEVQAIVCANQRHAVEVWEQAKSNNTEQFFGQLAYQNSVEPMSKANYGKVPPIRRHGGHPQVEDEAFRLKTGELSGVVASGDKFIVLRCLGRTKPVVTELATVKDELYKDLHEKKLRIAMNEEMDRMYSAAQIDNFMEKTAQVGDQRTQASPASTRSSKRSPVSEPDCSVKPGQSGCFGPAFLLILGVRREPAATANVATGRLHGRETTAAPSVEAQQPRMHGR